MNKTKKLGLGIGIAAAAAAFIYLNRGAASAAEGGLGGGGLGFGEEDSGEPQAMTYKEPAITIYPAEVAFPAQPVPPDIFTPPPLTDVGDGGGSGQGGVIGASVLDNLISGAIGRHLISDVPTYTPTPTPSTKKESVAAVIGRAMSESYAAKGRGMGGLTALRQPRISRVRGTTSQPRVSKKDAAAAATGGLWSAMEGSYAAKGKGMGGGGRTSTTTPTSKKGTFSSKSYQKGYQSRARKRHAAARSKRVTARGAE